MRFPRVSGDEPVWDLVKNLDKMFSSCEWG